MTSTLDSSRRLRVGVSSTIREFVREPINLALLFVLPPVVITAYGSILSAFPDLPSRGVDPSTLGAISGTLFVAGFLPGVIGLFQVISARRADERLLLAGYPAALLFGARLLAVVVASAITATIAVTVLLTRVEVASLTPAFGTLAFVGVLYGLIGMFVGAVLPRELEGSLVLIFLVDIDEALASGLLDTDAAFARLLPLHYPNALFKAAVEGETMASSDALAAGAYFLAVSALALGAYARVTGEGGVLG